jgi:hypothetical protein
VDNQFSWLQFDLEIDIVVFGFGASERALVEPPKPTDLD